MSNEELVSHIQSGSVEYMEPLWWQVERFVKSRAGALAAVLSPRYGVTFDDLYNCGFIAMTKAVETYRAGEGMSFISWLAYYLRNEFAAAAGYRTKKIITLNRCASLDAPLPGDDDGDTTRGDLIADPTEHYANCEERIYSAQLRKALEDVIADIDAEQREIIEQHYFQGLELAEIDKRSGAEKYTAKRKHDKALRSVRKKVFATAAGKRLRDFVDENTNFYRHVSKHEFLNTQTSAVEKTVFERESLAHKGADNSDT